MVAGRGDRLSGRSMTKGALGFGVSGPHGARWFSERDLHRLIAQAIDGGIMNFDTAPFYGEAEARLGRALAATGGGRVIISTKTGTRRDGRGARKDFSAAGMRTDVETSLKRLNRDRIDMLYLHGPSPDEIDAARPALAALVEEGKIGGMGVCGEGLALDRAIENGFHAIMGVYNVADRRHEAVFGRARASGVLAVAIEPLAQGRFSESRLPPRRPADLWRIVRAFQRGPAPAAEAQRVCAALESVEGQSPTGAALAFVLCGGAVDLALTTTTDAAHLTQSLDAARKGLGPAALAALLTLRGVDPS